MFRLEQETAEQLASDIADVPGVAQLHSGRFGEIALLYPKSRVVGLRINDEALEVHIVAEFGVNYQELAQSIREIATRTGEIPAEAAVDVYISDLAESE